MSGRFNRLVAKMPELLKVLESKPFLTRDNLGGIPQKGVYVFYKNDRPIYVGRSNRLKSRILQHGRPSSMHNSASFAFKLAKKTMSNDKDIPKDITRKELENAPGFAEMFYIARANVAQMKIRAIRIDDQVTQALFEIYAALTLKTPYNDFSTH